MPHAFVSYSRWARRDTSLPVENILADLRVSGVNLWLAPDDVPAGADYQQSIETAVASADVVLWLASKHLRKARGMKREFDQAQDDDVPVLVLDIGEYDADLLPTEAHNLPHYDFVGDYDGALAALLRDLPPTVKQRHAVAEHAPRSKGYVFISYAEEDAPFVDSLRQFLKGKGYGYWDYRESERNYQALLTDELEDVIIGAYATISVLSPDWKKSKWTAKEYLFSDDVGVPVFLVMAREMGPTLVTAGVPYIDFTKDADSGFSRLDYELKKRGLA